MLEKLGAGGVGTVYKARDILLKRIVAIKLLNTASLHPDHIVRLHREAKVICKLKHPNIVDVYDFAITSSDSPMMIMEYVEGESLDELIKRLGTIDQEKALLVIEQLSRAIGDAHEHGILHRDLKPANVMVLNFDTKCEVKVIDFGLAKVQELEDSSLTGSGSVVGTVAYMSPEQARNGTVDERSDIYSLGCVIYEILTGNRLFSGETILDVVRQQIERPASPLAEGNSSLSFSPQLEKFVAKALKKEPAERFQNMKELQAEFSEIKGMDSGLKIDVPEFDTGDTKWFSKNVIPILFSVIALFAVVLYVVSWGLSFQSESRQNRLQERSNTAYEIRSQFDLDHKIVMGKDWIIIEGKVSDAQLESLTRLKVRRLKLSGSSITDDQLKLLKGLPLLMLDLRNTGITDDGIETISGMNGLKSLLIQGCPNLTGAGIQKLAKLKTVEVLDLSESVVGDEDVKPLLQHSKIYLLFMQNCTNITDKSIDEILKLNHLVSLRLGGTQVSINGIEKLKAHKNLTFIGLRGMKIGGKNIPSFNERIAMLDLSSTKLTENNVFFEVMQLPNLWYLNVRDCEFLPPKAQLLVRRKLPLAQGKIALTDLVPDVPQIEWYYDPEIVSSINFDSKEERIPFVEKLWYGPAGITEASTEIR